MFKINENYLKLPGSYLFSTIAKKVSAYSAANPDKEIIRLGIGDVTLPLAPVVIDSLHNAVDEMGKAETFHGYAPDLGYEFLRNAIVEHDYKKRGADISADEIFVSDGAKSDSGNIGDIFSVDNKIAVCDPVYPVYLDTNIMAGRTGLVKEDGTFEVLSKKEVLALKREQEKLEKSLGGIKDMEEFKKIFLLGIGAASMTYEKSMEIINDMVKKGKLTLEEGKQIGDELRKSMKDKASIISENNKK